MNEEEKLMFEHHRRKLSSNLLDFTFVDTILAEAIPYLRWIFVIGAVFALFTVVMR